MTEQQNPLTTITPNADNELFNQIAKSGSWLPRLQLFGGSSEAVKLSKIPMNNWGLVPNKDEIVDLGKEIDVLVIDWRAKALDTADRSKIKNHFDPKSAEFQACQAKSEIKDSGCMYGPEFLVWIPSQKTFALLFMSSKTARSEAKRVRTQVGLAATLTSKTIKTDKYIWQGPVCKPLTATLPILPSDEDLKTEHEKFRNPKATEVEEVKEGDSNTTERDR